MELWYVNDENYFWYLVAHGRDLIRYYGMSGVLAFSKEEQGSPGKMKKLVKRYESEWIQDGFEKREGMPQIEFSKARSWERDILPPGVRYFKHPGENKFWLIGIGEEIKKPFLVTAAGTPGKIGLSGGRRIDAADVDAVMRRLIWEQITAGYREYPLPEDIFFVLIRGMIQAELRARSGQ